MNRGRTNCAHARRQSVILPLKLAAKRRSKGQRYYPRPSKALADSTRAELKAVRPSCFDLRTTDFVPAL